MDLDLRDTRREMPALGRQASSGKGDVAMLAAPALYLALAAPLLVWLVWLAWLRATKKRRLFPCFFGTKDALDAGFQDVDKWLGCHFNDPILLRRGLLESNAAIVGSRVLDFFSPGFCKATKSDWDFSVPNNPACVWRLMTRLNQCGVRWLPSDSIANIIAESFDVATVNVSPERRAFRLLYSFRASLEEIDAAYQSEVSRHRPNSRIVQELIKIQAHVQAIAALANNMLNAMPFRISAYYNDGGRILVALPADCSGHNGDDYFWGGASVVNGELCHMGKITKVQVIATTGGYWTHVLNFHSSCVQGFINGETAALLYPQETSRKQYFAWRTTHPRRRDEAARAKYQARGFTQLSLAPANTTQLRRLGSGPTMVVNLGTQEPDWTLHEGDGDRTSVEHSRPLFAWTRVGARLFPHEGNLSQYVVATVDEERTTLEEKVRYCRRHGVRLVGY